MKISDKIRRLFGRRPPSEKEVAARAEQDIAREQSLEDPGDHASEANAQFRL
jgi:hypothetical protein